MSQGMCPNFLLFRCFHFRLTFESIKELGSTSNISKHIRMANQCLYFVNWDAFIINNLCWIQHVFVFPCNFSKINTWTFYGNSQKNSIKHTHVYFLGNLWGVYIYYVIGHPNVFSWCNLSWTISMIMTSFNFSFLGVIVDIVHHHSCQPW